MNRRLAVLTVLGLLGTVAAWLLIRQQLDARQVEAGRGDDRQEAAHPAQDHRVGQLSAPLGPSVQDAALEQAMARVASAPDPFLAVGAEGDRFRMAPRRALALAERSWHRGEYWAACAVISVLGRSVVSDIPWLPERAGGAGTTESAVGALARWFIDADAEQVIAALLALRSRVGEAADADVGAVLHLLGNARVPTVEVIVGHLRGGDRRAAVAALRGLGVVATEAVPAMEQEVERLAALPATPIFGEDENVDFMWELSETLPLLGEVGRAAVVRLLFSSNEDASESAERTILRAPELYEVTDVLQEAARATSSPPPLSAYTVLARLPSAAAEWDATLRFVTGSRDEARVQFLDAVLAAQLDHGKVEPLISVMLTWQSEDALLGSRIYDVLAKLAPQDERTGAIVERALATGTHEEALTMLGRMGPRLSAFTERVRAAALALASSPVAAIRAAVMDSMARCPPAVGHARALALIEGALLDEAEDVVAAGMRAMASRGLEARVLIGLAIVRGADRSPPTQLELLRALGASGAERGQVEAQFRVAWSSAVASPDREALLGRIVDALEQNGVADRPQVAKGFLATDSIPEGTRSRLQNLASAGP